MLPATYVQTARRSARILINLPLRLFRLEIVRKEHDWTEPKDFIPLHETLAAAKAAGLSVPDYVDVQYNKRGATQETIDRMAELGVFNVPIRTVVEIGPGSGRYLEKTRKRCAPEHYEIYETAADWAEYLVNTYRVQRRRADGLTLPETADDSVDLLQAHKVFVCTPFLTTMSYFSEVARVVRKGGKVVFDMVTEDCMGEANLAKWAEAGFHLGSYPNLLPRRFVVDFFLGHGFVLDGTFTIPMEPGMTECFVFTRKSK
jgi:SAM-dependent methyltransferase